MGYFKNQQIAEQENVDRLVGWYRYHEDKLPASYIEWLLEDDDLLWASIEHWENVPYAPISAKKHVALWSRDYIRQERAQKRLDRRDHAIVFISLSLVLLASAAAIVWASL